MTKRAMVLLALVAALAAAPAAAEEFTTSSGVHSLRPLTTINSAVELRQATRAGERALAAQLADLATMEAARSSVSGELSSIPEQVRAAQAVVDRTREAFQAMNTKYLADLAAFQQKQVALDADVQRQRSEAAVLQALPSAQRDHATVERLNRWATELGSRRDGLGLERDKLLKDHEAVESERLKLAKAGAEAEARLKTLRDATVDRHGQANSKIDRVYAELARVVAYEEQAHKLLQARFGGLPEPAPELDRARRKLALYQAAKR